MKSRTSKPAGSRRDPRASDGKREAVLLRLDSPLYESVFSLAKLSGRSFTAEVVEALKAYVSSKKNGLSID